MTALCRFELLLPLRYNDGTRVPTPLISRTVAELEQRFGAVTWETQVLHGYWRQQGVAFQDELVRLFVDTSDTPETRAFFRDFKEQLKLRFQQLDLWLTVHPIEIL